MVSSKKKNVEKPDGYVFGRPTKYEKKYCQQLIDHMAKGLSLESFAGEIGTCKQTIYTWRDKHKDFMDALKRGRAKQQLTLEKLMMAQAVGKVKGSPASMIFILKNTIGWSDEGVSNQTEDVEGIDFV